MGLGSTLLSVCLLTSSIGPAPSDETVAIVATSGDDGADLATKFATAWSQVGAYACSVTNNVLTITNTNGDCSPKVMRFRFTGSISGNVAISLRIVCSFPDSIVDFDAQGPVSLVPGNNGFSSGSGSININYRLQNAVPFSAATVPAMPAWSLGALALLLPAAALLVRRKRRRAA